MSSYISEYIGRRVIVQFKWLYKGLGNEFLLHARFVVSGLFLRDAVWIRRDRDVHESDYVLECKGV